MPGTIESIGSVETPDPAVAPGVFVTPDSRGGLEAETDGTAIGSDRTTGAGEGRLTGTGINAPNPRPSREGDCSFLPPRDFAMCMHLRDDGFHVEHPQRSEHPRATDWLYGLRITQR